MAFLVQNESGTIAGANAYVTVAEFRAYELDRGNDVRSYGTTDVENAIVKATDYIDSRFRFVGERYKTTQRTAWPRLDAYDRDDLLRSGIPQEVKDACCDYAYLALTGTDLDPVPTRDATGRVVSSKSSTVGPISDSVTYANGATYSEPQYPIADRKLRASGLTVSGATIRRA
jgi:hypothetical protein